MAEWRVMYKEHCSCVQMNYPKCKLCDAQGFMEFPDWKATAESIRARIAELEAKLAEAQRDAERYRFIRNRSPALELIGRQNIIIGNFEAELDAAIDAALASKTEGA